MTVDPGLLRQVAEEVLDRCTAAHNRMEPYIALPVGDAELLAQHALNPKEEQRG